MTVSAMQMADMKVCAQLQQEIIAMRGAGQGGAIVNTSSTLATGGAPVRRFTGPARARSMP